MRYSFLLLSLLIPFYVFGNEWQLFKDKFLRADGNIVDPYNYYRTTSESQGYGMVLAVLNNDKDTFDKIWNWTKKNLKNNYGLFAWHWNGGKIIDKNNAIDGDLLIAYGLFLAYKKWNNQHYKYEYKNLENKVKSFIIPICNNRNDLLLMPAKYGFIHEGNLSITIFPSYYIPFIFRDFYMETKNNLWRKIHKYTYFIYKIKNITTNLHFSLLDKEFTKDDIVNLDTYRIILYSYLDNKNNVSLLKETFSEINDFFNKNGYIPLNYRYNKINQEKKESPYCVYKWFYILYKDENYLNKYKSLKALDKNNYFCMALDTLYEGLKGRM